MGWIEQQLRALAQRTEYLFRLIQQYRQQQQNDRQQLYAAWQQTSPGGGGGGVVYFFVPGSAMSAASGNPPSGVPTSLANQTVYALSGGTYSSVSTTATVYNAATVAITASKVAYLMKNADNSTYTVINQSC